MISLRVLLIAGISIVFIGCASTNQHEVVPRKIDRISEDELGPIMSKPIATLSLNDLVSMTKEGISADAIIEKIRASNSYYDLSPSEILDLNNKGVNDKVLDYIHSSRELALRNNVAEEINKREKAKRDELEKLKRQQLLERQQQMYDPACGYSYRGVHPYGYGGFGRRTRIGMGFGIPFGCW